MSTREFIVSFSRAINPVYAFIMFTMQVLIILSSAIASLVTGSLYAMHVANRFTPGLTSSVLISVHFSSAVFIIKDSFNSFVLFQFFKISLKCMYRVRHNYGNTHFIIVFDKNSLI